MKKQIIVTGASRGIGLALSQLLLEKGYTVIGTSRSGLIKDIVNKEFSCLKLDLSNAKSITAFAAQIGRLESPIDLLINNAGVGPDLGFDLPEPNSYEATFEVNVKGTVQLTEELIKSISDQGKILNVSSKMGSIDYCEKHDSVAYRMSKSALNMYSKILSKRLEGKIAVASIHPGWVKTTINKSNVNGRLTAKESATRIIDYIAHRFQNGDFWDAEGGVKLKW